MAARMLAHMPTHAYIPVYTRAYTHAYTCLHTYHHTWDVCQHHTGLLRFLVDSSSSFGNGRDDGWVLAMGRDAAVL